MNLDPVLPDEETWQPDGHLSDVALTALADGERSILPEAAARHADACEHCTQRLGRTALLSVSVGEALGRAPNAAAVPSTKPVRLPVAALAAALILAGFGAVPALFEAPRWLTALPAALVQGVPIALRAALAIFKVASSASVSVVLVSVVAACVLCMMGIFIARLAPRELAWKGVRK